MSAQVLTFPQHRSSQVFIGTLPDAATPLEEAIYHVRRARAVMDASGPLYRRYQIARITLEWWQGELARLLEEAA
jgi:hypothetical protein